MHMTRHIDAPQDGTHSILIVDDDADILAALEATLSRSSYEIVSCTKAAKALEILATRPFACVICDQHMPEINGLQVLEKVREHDPLCSRILITGMLAVDTLIKAINSGEIYRFIAKPWNQGEVVATIKNAVQRYKLLVENEYLHAQTRSLNGQLEAANWQLKEHLRLLTEQKESIDSAHDALRQNFEQSLGLCFRLIGSFYPLLGKQTQAVVEICRLMAATDHFTERERHVLMTSSWIYDIGLVEVERSRLHKLLNKPESCTVEERALMRQHPALGQTLAGFVDQLKEVGVTIRAHHERFDGTGYPDGLVGNRIPWTARCLAVAVTFVQCGLPKEKACQYLISQSGTGLDPEAVRLFFQVNELSNLPRDVREVMMSELQDGMELARGIITPSGVLLMPEGSVLRESSIQRLWNHCSMHLVTERLLVYSN